MYEELWELVQIFIQIEEDKAKQVKRLKAQQEKLTTNAKVLEEQRKFGYDGDPDEDSLENEVRKMYKTIMCPLKEACPKVKMLRWPSSSLKATSKFGKDCPYAHHPMELQFPESLQLRIRQNQKLINADKQKDSEKQVFKFSGPLTECRAKCSRCTYCLFRQMLTQKWAQGQQQKLKRDAKQSQEEVAALAERKKENDKSVDLFIKKFGILKKASVLLYHDRANDAFDEIAKAAQIIKDQQEAVKEQELALQRRWQFKLGLPDGLELPKPVEKIRPEDVTEAFVKQIDAAGKEPSTLRLYISKVCPQIRNQYSRDTFLNGLIEDLYYRCEDVIVDRKNDIQKLSKQSEKLGYVWEQLGPLVEEYGSLATIPKDVWAENMVDNDGNPMRLKKPKQTICPYVQQRKLYKDEGVAMKGGKGGKEKYFVQSTITRKNVLDAETQIMKSVVCPNGKNCPYAHTAIELDFQGVNETMRELAAAIGSQTNKMKNDKPSEPWRPSTSKMKPAEPPKPVQKKKAGEDEENEKEKKNERKSILERENVFRKPYEKN
jgi:hypothetical protein